MNFQLYRCFDAVVVKLMQYQLINRHMATFTIDFLTCTGELVERLALMLQGGIHGRHLSYFTTKLRQRVDNIVTGDISNRMRIDDFTLGVCRVSAFTELDAGQIAFIRVEQKLRNLGRLTETQRQDPGCQRVERPGMTGLGASIQPFGALQTGVGTYPQRLVY